jgi:cytochrome c peroxidase
MTRSRRSFTIRVAVAVAGFLASCGDPAPRSAGGDDGAAASRDGAAGERGASRVASRNAHGVALTVNVAGGPVVDLDGPFSRAFGTNGRSCATCHAPEAGMAITPALVERAFRASRGEDPIFRTNDGATSPLADVSTVAARRRAYALLLDRALIRVGLPVPAGAEFSLLAVDDPYGFASAAELSLFRRPLPAANLAFLSTVMWDGRETFRCEAGRPCSAGANGDASGFATVHFDLSDQANGATLGHAQAAAPLTDAEREAIVAHESALFTAQQADDGAGPLDEGGAQGGPLALAAQPFHFGVNDTFGAFGEAFSAVAMTVFDAWAGAKGHGGRRAAIARGQALFNSRTFTIDGVAGVNDVLGGPTTGTCTTCHDTPNAGDHSVPAPLRIGVDDPSPAGGLDASGLPVYTLRNDATGQTVRTTDPGRALVTGKWADVGKFKGPVLRGLASRPPYFHNGSARTLDDVVRFYDERFGIGLTPGEKADLAAFLAAL